MQQMLELLGSSFGSAYFLSIHTSLEREEVGLKNATYVWKGGKKYMVGRRKEKREYSATLDAILP